jgi:phosphate transport system permease protein
MSSKDNQVLTDQAEFFKRNRKRKIKDFFSASSTYLFSSFSAAALIAIVVFVFSKGWSTLSWDFLTSDYEKKLWNVETSSSIKQTTNTFDYSPKENEYFSSNWGIAFTDSLDNESLAIVKISYVDYNANINGLIDSSSQEPFTLKEGETIESVQLWTTSDPNTASVMVVSSKDGASKMKEVFDSCSYLKNMTVSNGGGGIRGSLISTFYVILMTMAIALPLGIGGAIYLGVYSDSLKGPFKPLAKILRNLIDMISGIPSIVFGLVGGIVFLPLVGGKGNLISGSLTLACMILPIIIKATEEAIRAIPKNMSLASLALGASETQTTFKVILPNAIPGILTSALLGIGRVIGESAALIYTAGTAIQDYIIPTQGSATLAVHIWSLMSGESQNYEASCAISIVILFVILLLNILIKLLSVKINRYQKGK